tara:strand:+ start:11187 stop:12566 length:1380 start_codon:yes stop_codon:yes gene_type:complete
MKYNKKDAEEISSFVVNEGDKKTEYTVSILRKKETENYFLKRVAKRNKVKNLVDSYTSIDEKGTHKILPLSLDACNEIVKRVVEKEMLWSDAFVFRTSTDETNGLDWTKTESEHKYTSTGIKFWRHKKNMESYRSDQGKSIISTHISPEGACNLKCPYCSVTYRDTHSRIPLDKIKNYVTQLKERGLKAVILTGGGEPTIYKHFNELVMWLKHEMNLSVGLITNGTRIKNVHDETFKCFSWIRVSINVFRGWEEIISLPYEKLDSECIVGCSMVYTVEHELSEEVQRDRLDLFRKVSKVADNCGAKYIRVLPNCLLDQQQLLLEHKSLKEMMKKIDDPRYFQQYKIHGAPKTSKCHQAYFRPYLSEEPWHEDGEPGSVYPCDSVVLNSGVAHFANDYQICKPENIGDFLDRKIDMRFDAKKMCTGCVFTENVNMLDDWYNFGENRFSEFDEPLKHEEFV